MPARSRAANSVSTSEKNPNTLALSEFLNESTTNAEEFSRATPTMTSPERRAHEPALTY